MFGGFTLLLERADVTGAEWTERSAAPQSFLGTKRGQKDTLLINKSDLLIGLDGHKKYDDRERLKEEDPTRPPDYERCISIVA